MSSRSTALLFAFGAIVIAVNFGFYYRISEPVTPVYRGRPASWWAAQCVKKAYFRHTAAPPERGLVFEALYSMTRLDVGPSKAGEGDGGILLYRGDPAALPVLVELLDDPDPRVRLTAVEGLGRLPSRCLVGLLSRLTKAAIDKDVRVRELARRLIAKT